MIQQAIARLLDGHALSPVEITESLDEIVQGEATPAQVGGFLVALRGKGETVDEIVAFASAFRRYSLRIEPAVSGRLVDTCGTGGDSTKTFNVSTISALVAAGAGVSIAKHGNRSMTSKCGSADLLESLGFNLGMEPGRVKDSIEQVGIGFMFAPAFHPAMRRVGPVRKELGVRTVFNIMGPLINPAGANAQLLGVYSESLNEKMAQALNKLGCQEAMVIHGLEGMDEISVSGRTRISWLKNGEVTTRDYVPAQMGISAHPGESVAVSSVEESRRITLELLGENSKGGTDKDGRLEMVLVNAAAAIIVAGKAGSFTDALPLARESVASGAAFKKLEGLVRFSGGDLVRLETHAAGR
ncbi:MAG: anthranilate phosphoribosyltransferase [Thaumarchaeota archaeon]|nr:anthranilate phosphoribosyltransferase [Nitrososphaerota archaeon]